MYTSIRVDIGVLFWNSFMALSSFCQDLLLHITINGHPTCTLQSVTNIDPLSILLNILLFQTYHPQKFQAGSIQNLMDWANECYAEQSDGLSHRCYCRKCDWEGNDEKNENQIPPQHRRGMSAVSFACSCYQIHSHSQAFQSSGPAQHKHNFARTHYKIVTVQLHPPQLLYTTSLKCQYNPLKQDEFNLNFYSKVQSPWNKFPQFQKNTCQIKLSVSHSAQIKLQLYVWSMESI